MSFGMTFMTFGKVFVVITKWQQGISVSANMLFMSRTGQNVTHRYTLY